jgi:chemotaxis protein CheD
MSLAAVNIERGTHFLQPGHLFVGPEPTTVTTILGSCVAVCLWDQARQIGGINHFMLPAAPGGGPPSPRFGDAAMKQLLDALSALGARPRSLQARVFGGACVLAAMRSESHLGKKNADVAMDFLTRAGIRIVEVDTGGNRGRKLIYRTDEGSACLNLI